MITKKLRKAVRCLSDPAFRAALIRHAVAASVEHQFLLRSIPCSAVIDVGANRGQFALVARRVHSQATIIAFEPLPAPAERFRHMFAGDTQVTLHQAAISPARGETAIHISGRDDSSSLLPITAAQSRLFPGTAEAGTATVKVGPLADFLTEDQIKSPALLKLDVQGYELEALRGCDSLLGRFAHVYCECSFVELYEGQALADEVIAWLRERGFKLQGIYNTHYDRKGRAVQADFLLSRQQQ